jgi:hypothetical protein
VALSPAEERVVAKIRRAKLFVFLRRHRHELFDDAFQAELGTIFKDSPRGQSPVSPAQLALATILQAYTRVSDEEVIEATRLDGRWQLVLDCLERETVPFGKATFQRFRDALIAHELDRRLIERTVAVAEQSGDFGSRRLRAALDSSPLWGAGRVEDTYNLIGHALHKAMGVIARQEGWDLTALAHAAGAGLVGGSSLKAALDLNWDEPAQRQRALGLVLAALAGLEGWVDAHPAVHQDATLQQWLGAAQQVRAQDVTTNGGGQPILRQGVAKDRRISIEDAEMRHGRKSRQQRVDGFKRHFLRDLDRHLIRAAGLTAANAPEATVTEPIMADLAHQQVELDEVHIDRAYLASSLVRERPPGLTIVCKAWPVRNGDRFTKAAFTLDFAHGVIRCPQAVSIPFQPGQTVHFPEATCAACPVREQCTTSAHGRSVSIHADEQLLVDLRGRQQTAAGRAQLRERVAIEHSLAHIGYWQGHRARYRGMRKNLFDARRMAVLENLHVLMPLMTDQPRAA